MQNPEVKRNPDQKTGAAAFDIAAAPVLLFIQILFLIQARLCAFIRQILFFYQIEEMKL